MDGSISTGKDLAKAKFRSHCRPQRGRKVQPHDQAQAHVAAQERWQKGDEAASEPARRSIGADLATLLEAAEHTVPTAYRFQSTAALAERNDEELLQEPGPDEQALTVDVFALVALLERLPLHELLEISVEECEPWPQQLPPRFAMLAVEAPAGAQTARSLAEAVQAPASAHIAHSLAEAAPAPVSMQAACSMAAEAPENTKCAHASVDAAQAPAGESFALLGRRSGAVQEARAPAVARPDSQAVARGLPRDPAEPLHSGGCALAVTQPATSGAAVAVASFASRPALVPVAATAVLPAVSMLATSPSLGEQGTAAANPKNPASPRSVPTAVLAHASSPAPGQQGRSAVNPALQAQAPALVASAASGQQGRSAAYPALQAQAPTPAASPALGQQSKAAAAPALQAHAAATVGGPPNEDRELDALLATLTAAAHGPVVQSGAGLASMRASAPGPVVEPQARVCAGGVTHLAAATPNTMDDLDALLGLR